MIRLAIRNFLDDQNISDVADLIYEYPDYEAQIIANMAINRAAAVFKILDVSAKKELYMNFHLIKLQSY